MVERRIALAATRGRGYGPDPYRLGILTLAQRLRESGYLTSGTMVMDVQLSEEERAEALRLGEKTFQRWQAVRGHYSNTPNSHYRGKVGESAVYKWAMQAGLDVEPIFKDLTRSGEADLLVSGRRIEVKTWADKWWPELGRCVAVGQLASLEAKADVVVWCHMDDDADGIVTLAGWSHVSGIAAAPVRMTGPKGRRQVQNHQLDDDDLKSMDELLTLFRTNARDA